MKRLYKTLREIYPASEDIREGSPESEVIPKGTYAYTTSRADVKGDAGSIGFPGNIIFLGVLNFGGALPIFDKGNSEETKEGFFAKDLMEEIDPWEMLEESCKALQSKYSPELKLKMLEEAMGEYIKYKNTGKGWKRKI